MRMPASRVPREFRLLREANAVRGRLHAEVPDLTRVPHGLEENRRYRRLAARELHRHLAPRLHRQRIVEELAHLGER
jgi:hypothetical protein